MQIQRRPGPSSVLHALQQFGEVVLQHGLELAHARLGKEGVEGRAALAVAVVAGAADQGLVDGVADQANPATPFVAPLAAARIDGRDEARIREVQFVGRDADNGACGLDV